MTFHIGQKVVRIPVGKGISGGNPLLAGVGGPRPIIGQIYTIRAINVWPTKTILRFEEFDFSHLIGIGGATIEPGWDSRGFRPIIERKRKTSIAVFKKMLAPRAREVESA